MPCKFNAQFTLAKYSRSAFFAVAVIGFVFVFDLSADGCEGGAGTGVVVDEDVVDAEGAADDAGRGGAEAGEVAEDIEKLPQTEVGRSGRRSGRRGLRSTSTTNRCIIDCSPEKEAQDRAQENSIRPKDTPAAVAARDSTWIELLETSHVAILLKGIAFC